MKKLIRTILSSICELFLRIRGVASIRDSRIFVLSVWRSDKSNHIALTSSNVSRSAISVCGMGNIVTVNGGNIHNTQIRIFGNNNSLQIDSETGIHNATIIIRGNNCKIAIGQHTSFGSVHMVCMGQGNTIEIGQECMFAEGIDIWSSDSHPIYNEQGEIINKSLPIHIEDKVWVGKDCKILKGVTIHTGAVIGMGSIVTKEVKAHTLNVGSPSRCIRENISWERNFITI